MTQSVSIEHDKHSNQIEKRKLDFLNKLSGAYNVLPYFAPIDCCDKLMRRFSTKSREIWVTMLKRWVDLLDDTLIELTITLENIKKWEDCRFLQNYSFKFIFPAVKIKDQPCYRRIQRFINQIPHKKQVKSFEILRPKRKVSRRNIGYFRNQLITKLAKISESLGYKYSGETVPLETGMIYLCYFGEIFHVEGNQDEMVCDNLYIVSVPNYLKSTICINSEFLINSKSIKVMSYNEKALGEGLSKETDKNYISVQEIIYSAIILTKASLKETISSFYPNLKSIYIDRRLADPHNENCEFLEPFGNPNAKIFIEKGYLHNGYQMKIASKKALIYNYLSFNCNSYKPIQDCELLVGSLIIYNNGICCICFKVLEFKNCSTCAQTDEEYSRTYKNSPMALLYQWCMIPISSITKIETNYTSFMVIENQKPMIPKFLEHRRRIPRIHYKNTWKPYSEEHNKLAQRLGKECEFTFRHDGRHECPPDIAIECIQNCLNAFLWKESNTSIDIPCFFKGLDVIGVFELTRICKFRRVNIVLGCYPPENRYKLETICKTIKDITRLQNMGNVYLQHFKDRKEFSNDSEALKKYRSQLNYVFEFLDLPMSIQIIKKY
ncbi:unnamed protein product [Moneuplotes crassus]|uniref:Uncharacterized protein n=1 Tax=Euplotes crassus TaxID=5936 RepID=A0AAD1Y256_EUPCR|nr:unnamed protein product [Moneuplotes crassus]